MNYPGVIVIGGHVQGLGIIRILGKRNIRCIIIDSTPINIAKHSKFCQSFIRYRSNRLLEFLTSLMNNEIYKGWILIPTKDEHVKVLSKNKKELEKHFIPAVANWDVVEECYNKSRTYKIAQELGIPIPKTWISKSIQDLKNLEIIFPCIVKPAIMHSFYDHFKTKVFVCNDFSELNQNYNRALSVIPEDEILIQEIIPGDSSNQYSACFLFDEDHAVVQLVARRLRQHPIDFGNATTFAETVVNDTLVRRAVHFLSHIGYKGICEVEFKHDPRDGTYKLLEINPRTWKWHYIAEATKSPFLEYLYSYVQGRPIGTNCLHWSEASWEHQLTDFFVKIRLKNFDSRNSSVQNKNLIPAVYDKEDIKPFIFERIYFPYLVLSR